MPMKRHTWYILIINLEIKLRCREIPHLLLDVQLNLNSWIQFMILKISLSLSINRIMDHCCPKVPTCEVCLTLIYGGYDYVRIVHPHYWYTKIHHSIINIYNSYKNSYTWFFHTHASRAVHDAVLRIHDYDLHTVHVVKLFRLKPCWLGPFWNVIIVLILKLVIVMPRINKL